MNLDVMQKFQVKARPLLAVASEAKQKLIQNQRSDAAGGISIKTLKRRVTTKF